MTAKSRLGKGLGALFPPLPGEEDTAFPSNGFSDNVSRETINEPASPQEEPKQKKQLRNSKNSDRGTRPSSQKSRAQSKHDVVSRKVATDHEHVMDLTAASTQEAETEIVSRETIDRNSTKMVSSDKPEEHSRSRSQSSDTQRRPSKDGIETDNRNNGVEGAVNHADSGFSSEKSGTGDKQKHKSIGGETQVSSRNVSRETSKQAIRKRNHIPAIKDMARPSDVFFGGVSDVVKKPNDGRRSAVADQVARREKSDLKPVAGGYLAELRLDQIGPNAQQPRTIFDEDELRELSASILEVGVLEPVVVRKRPVNESLPADRTGEEGMGSEYELIMGERRWRASKLAGLKSMPAIVKTTTDEHMLRDALLENLHRVALNPLEEAAAYQQMMSDFGMTQEQLSRSVSKSRPQIANMLRLLNLPGSVQKKVAAGVLSAGHARALLGLSSPEDMEKLANRVIAEGLSVRSTEEIVSMKMDSGAKSKKSLVSKAGFWNGSPVQQGLENRFDTKVNIKGNKKSGRIEIVFSSPEDMDRILGLLMPHNDENHKDGWV